MAKYKELDPRETEEWWWGGKTHGRFDRIRDINPDDEDTYDPDNY